MLSCLNIFIKLLLLIYLFTLTIFYFRSLADRNCLLSFSSLSLVGDNSLQIGPWIQSYEFENHYNEMYPPELIFKKESTSYTETTFLDLHLCLNEGQIQTSFYDKKNSYNFNVVRFPHKSSTIPSKMFLQPLVQKYFESV